MLTPTGRKIDSAIEEAINAKARAETGATMNPTEKPNIDRRFKPSPYDDEELIKTKLNRLEKFLKGQVRVLDPSKRYSQDAIRYAGSDGKKYVWEPSKTLDRQTAIEFLKQAGGDKDKARKLAADQGYEY